ncbi:hypothetical protein B0T14DRAFT_313855 [Immersiella caudata]|uniref:Uncharacterized protein n=1 Tax=Immersiella caudata TaxID=314043 RepID=A0AA39TKN2_9PEZI|nr:hypothetical protein B0T14DRAFT_313855 [Immersiella caudata]
MAKNAKVQLEECRLSGLSSNNGDSTNLPTVPQISTHLWSWKGKTCVALVLLVSLLLSAAGAIGLGYKQAVGAQGSATLSNDVRRPQQRCGSRPVSATGVETQFEINLIMLQDLSFARAKLMDLLWDTVFAHGGRLLHGWIFYHVACRTVTWILEYSAFPYWFLLDVLFRPDSLRSLRTLLRSFATRHQRRTIYSLLLLTYGVGHVLFFSTLWSAATGYQSSDIAGYILPDYTHLYFPDRDDLRMCWVVDAGRIPASYHSAIGNFSEVVLGPKVGSIFPTLEDLLWQEGRSMWARSTAWNSSNLWNITEFGEDTESDFRDILSCQLHMPLEPSRTWQR